MENLRTDVILYVNRLVEQRLSTDPNKLTAFRTLAIYFDINRNNCTHTERNQMICNLFGDQNQDLSQVYFAAVQELYEPALRIQPVEDRAGKLLKLAKMCHCIQFMDLYRERFPIDSTYYQVLSNAVSLFILDQITESQLCAHLNSVLLENPDFRNELEARVNRLTSLFRAGGSGGGDGNNPGAGNPPPQA